MLLSRRLSGVKQVSFDQHAGPEAGNGGSAVSGSYSCASLYLHQWNAIHKQPLFSCCDGTGCKITKNLGLLGPPGLPTGTIRNGPSSETCSCSGGAHTEPAIRHCISPVVVSETLEWIFTLNLIRFSPLFHSVKTSLGWVFSEAKHKIRICMQVIYLGIIPGSKEAQQERGNCGPPGCPSNEVSQEVSKEGCEHSDTYSPKSTSRAPGLPPASPLPSKSPVTMQSTI